MEEKSENLSKEVIDSSNDLKSKKFIAYIIGMVVAIGAFIFVYLQSKSSTDFQKFLDFILYSLGVYVGGNSIERITNVVSKK
jgi:hypothetical protein